MTHLAIGLWLLNVCLDTFGQLAFKAAATQPHSAQQSYWQALIGQRWLWLGIACYVFEIIVWLAFLSLVPLSEGVLFRSINIIVLMLAGRLWFAEKLTPMRVIGISLVTVGVALVGIGQ
jgi:drug/metabolite transporter (DMT)-like permease